MAHEDEGDLEALLFDYLTRRNLTGTADALLGELAEKQNELEQQQEARGGDAVGRRDDDVYGLEEERVAGLAGDGGEGSSASEPELTVTLGSPVTSPRAGGEGEGERGELGDSGSDDETAAEDAAVEDEVAMAELYERVRRKLEERLDGDAEDGGGGEEGGVVVDPADDASIVDGDNAEAAAEAEAAEELQRQDSQQAFSEGEASDGDTDSDEWSDDDDVGYTRILAAHVAGQFDLVLRISSLIATVLPEDADDAQYAAAAQEEGGAEHESGEFELSDNASSTSDGLQAYGGVPASPSGSTGIMLSPEYNEPTDVPLVEPYNIDGMPLPGSHDQPGGIITDSGFESGLLGSGAAAGGSRKIDLSAEAEGEGEAGADAAAGVAGEGSNAQVQVELPADGGREAATSAPQEGKKQCSPRSLDGPLNYSVVSEALSIDSPAPALLNKGKLSDRAGRTLAEAGEEGGSGLGSASAYLTDPRADAGADGGAGADAGAAPEAAPEGSEQGAGAEGAEAPAADDDDEDVSPSNSEERASRAQFGEESNNEPLAVFYEKKSNSEPPSPAAAGLEADAAREGGDAERSGIEAVAAGGAEAADGAEEQFVEDEEIYECMSLKVIYQKNHTGFEEHKEFPIRIDSIVAGRYQIVEYLGSAAFSKAVQCMDLHTGQMVCIKIIKNNKDFFDQSLDEIKLLKYINSHEDADQMNVLQLFDYFYYKEHLFIVCELLRDNLYEFSKYNRDTPNAEPYFTLPRLQRITRQCLEALAYIHTLRLIHADLKPENILIKSFSRCEVKVIDFGSSCYIHDVLSSYVQSRSYRAPEVILGMDYDYKIDIWSLGCIIAELWTGAVLFDNDSVQTLLARLAGIIGPFDSEWLLSGRYTNKYFTPSLCIFETDPETQDEVLLVPKVTSLRKRLKSEDEAFVDFLECMLKVNPAERFSAVEALGHPWLATSVYLDWSTPSFPRK